MGEQRRRVFHVYKGTPVSQLQPRLHCKMLANHVLHVSPVGYKQLLWCHCPCKLIAHHDGPSRNLLERVALRKPLESPRFARFLWRFVNSSANEERTLRCNGIRVDASVYL